MADLTCALCKSPAAFLHGDQGMKQKIRSKCPIKALYRCKLVCGYCLSGCVIEYSDHTCMGYSLAYKKNNCMFIAAISTEPFGFKEAVEKEREGRLSWASRDK